MTENPGDSWKRWVVANRAHWERSKKDSYNYENFAQCEACLAYTHHSELAECLLCRTLCCVPCLDSDTGYHGPGLCEKDLAD